MYYKVYRIALTALTHIATCRHQQHLRRPPLRVNSTRNAELTGTYVNQICPDLLFVSTTIACVELALKGWSRNLLLYEVRKGQVAGPTWIVMATARITFGIHSVHGHHHALSASRCSLFHFIVHRSSSFIALPFDYRQSPHGIWSRQWSRYGKLSLSLLQRFNWCRLSGSTSPSVQPVGSSRILPLLFMTDRHGT